MKFILHFILLFILAACGDSENRTETKNSPSRSSSERTFTAFELEHGIGPIKQEIALGTINPSLAETGKAIFEMKCVSCHQMDTRFVGPPLGDVIERRSPAFIMNFMLNPSDMARQHPEGKKLLAEYLTPMPFQNVSEDDARALLEYLRTVAENN
jgi:cytochrome c